MRRIAVMNREEMLKELKTIDLRAIQERKLGRYIMR